MRDSCTQLNRHFLFYDRSNVDYSFVNENDKATEFLKSDYRKEVDLESFNETYKDDDYQKASKFALDKLQNKKDKITLAITFSAASRLLSSGGSYAAIVVSTIICATSWTGIGAAIAGVALLATGISIVYTSHKKRILRKQKLEQLENETKPLDQKDSTAKKLIDSAEDASSITLSAISHSANPPPFISGITACGNFLTYGVLGAALGVIEYLADNSISEDDKEIYLLEKFTEKRKQNLTVTDPKASALNKIFLDNYCRLQNSTNKEEIGQFKYFLDQCLLYESISVLTAITDPKTSEIISITGINAEQILINARLSKDELIAKQKELKTFIYNFNRSQQLKETDHNNPEIKTLESSLKTYYWAANVDENNPAKKIVDKKSAVKAGLVGALMALTGFALGSSISALAYGVTSIALLTAAAPMILLPLIAVGAIIFGVISAVKFYKNKGNSSLAGTLAKAISVATNSFLPASVAAGAGIVGTSTYAVASSLGKNQKTEQVPQSGSTSSLKNEEESNSGNSSRSASPAFDTTEFSFHP